MGGSTTYGRPYNHQSSFAAWLGEFLSAADDTRDWEVINAGGISYASYRVAMLMEELTQYQPDLFVVYSGHNEFLERRTYQTILQTPSALRNLHARLLGNRTFSLMYRLTRAANRTPTMGVAGRDLLPAEVDAILDHTAGPETYRRDDELREQVLQHYRFSLERMVAVARAAGAVVIFVTPASNLKDFLPFKSEHRAALDAIDRNLWLGHLHAAGEAFEEDRFAQALQSLDQAAEIDDRHARLHFLRGRLLLRMNREAEARQAFQRARDEDVCPLRALTPMRDIVVGVARKQEVPVIDFAGMMEERAPHGIPGDEWFLDHVHPTMEGHRALALALLDEMQGRGLVTPGNSWGEQAIQEATARVENRMDHHAHANALRNLAKVLRWAGKFEQSAKLAIRAVEGLPYDAEAHCLAAEAWWQRGELDLAVAEYEQAIRIDPDCPTALLKLGSLLLEKGQAEAAENYLQRAVRIAPDEADAHFRLANALFVLADFERAEVAYEEAIRLDPQLADGHKNLGLIAARRQRFEAAEAHFERALGLDPADPAVHCELGFLLVARERYESATSEFSLTLMLDPDHARAYLGLGCVAEAQGNLREAARRYRQALSVDSESEAARARLDRVTRRP
jgi:tetratricopeptide (TPR) repeat protein